MLRTADPEKRRMHASRRRRFAMFGLATELQTKQQRRKCHVFGLVMLTHVVHAFFDS